MREKSAACDKENVWVPSIGVEPRAFRPPLECSTTELLGDADFSFVPRSWNYEYYTFLKHDHILQHQRKGSISICS